MRFLGSLWAFPCTLLGMLAAAFGGAITLSSACPVEFVARTRGPWAWFFRRVGFRAITIGECIVWRDREAAAIDRLRAHEFRHVAQYRRLGVLFLVAYPLLSLLAVVMGREAHDGNWLEGDADTSATEDGHAR